MAFRSICVTFSYAGQTLNQAFRFYGKNILRRRAIRVIESTPEKRISVPPIYDQSLDLKKNDYIVRNKNEDSVTIYSSTTNQIAVPFEKLQKNDSRFTKVLRIIKSRKHREESGQILLEGKRLVNDAIEAGLELTTLFFSRSEILSEIKLQNIENVKLYKVLYRNLEVWSDLTTCPGIMGIFKKPSTEDILAWSEPTMPVTLICDNIRDPGNLGSIIRNSAAAGVQNVLLMKGCVDPWELKVLRSACGGHFRVPIINNIEWSQISNYMPKSSTLYIADNSSDIDGDFSMDYLDFSENTEDISEQRYVCLNENSQPVLVDETYEQPDALENYKDIPLPCFLYSSLTFPKKDIVLYVGGETHGVDPKVLKLACEYSGKKIKIPLENGMESLNSSFSVAIILYEIKRQLVELYKT